MIDAVRNGEAEIGFVAYNPERAGPVEFSKPYLLVNQTFLVKSDSPIRSIADIDRQGRKLGATRADSIALYLGRTLKQGSWSSWTTTAATLFIECCETARSTRLAQTGSG